MNFLNNYGLEVFGYDTRVLNEREARASAGILAMSATFVMFLAIGFGHTILAKFYLSFMFFDFTVRLINPNYSPTLLLGRLFITEQKPVYVGAEQKRFAWFIGWLLLIPMMWWFVLNWDISFYKVLICVLCAFLMFLESAFSICIGCIIYQYILRKNTKYCPGGSCELQFKEPAQKFNNIQKIITFFTILIASTGIYLFLANSTPKTFFGEFLHEAVLTKSQLEAKEQALFDEEVEREFKDF